VKRERQPLVAILRHEINSQILTHQIMRIIFLLVLTTVFLSSCEKKQTNYFEYIDFSRYGNDETLYSLKIYNNGKTNIYKYDLRKERKSFYTVTLDKMELDSITSLSKLILNAKFDTLNEFGCDRCFSYCLIINSNNHKFKTSFSGQLFSEKKMQLLDRFAVQVNKIANKHIETIDSTFLFESISGIILTPHPADQPNLFDKFIPKN
jgi:hypothetical protein